MSHDREGHPRSCPCSKCAPQPQITRREGKYSELRSRLLRLNDPEARFELGEDARRAQLAALADLYLLELLDGYERLERLLIPRAVPESTPDDPNGVFGAPGMMGG